MNVRRPDAERPLKDHQQGEREASQQERIVTAGDPERHRRG
jgi:hypothetical protein